MYTSFIEYCSVVLSTGEANGNNTQFFLSKKYILAQETGEQTGNLNIHEQCYIYKHLIVTEFNRGTKPHLRDLKRLPGGEK